MRQSETQTETRKQCSKSRQFNGKTGCGKSKSLLTDTLRRMVSETYLTFFSFVVMTCNLALLRFTFWVRSMTVTGSEKMVRWSKDSASQESVPCDSVNFSLSFVSLSFSDFLRNFSWSCVIICDGKKTSTTDGNTWQQNQAYFLRLSRCDSFQILFTSDCTLHVLANRYVVKSRINPGGWKKVTTITIVLPEWWVSWVGGAQFVSEEMIESRESRCVLCTHLCFVGKCARCRLCDRQNKARAKDSTF